ncbi:MAG: glyoxalase [Alphaproteobacteria bacterium]|nr:glyoxalase [Alphaproteobacteria bacterium]
MTERHAKAPPPFHLAIPVDDLAAADRFYAGVLGCPRGRSDERWIDYDFYGHQLVVHLVDHGEAGDVRNHVDGEEVPVRHFGAVLPADDWEDVSARLVAAGNRGDLRVIIPPTLRHEGRPGEQRVIFVRDPAGNALEFKTLTNPGDLFAA